MTFPSVRTRPNIVHGSPRATQYKIQRAESLHAASLDSHIAPRRPAVKTTVPIARLPGRNCLILFLNTQAWKRGRARDVELRTGPSPWGLVTCWPLSIPFTLTAIAPGAMRSRDPFVPSGTVARDQGTVCYGSERDLSQAAAPSR